MSLPVSTVPSRDVILSSELSGLQIRNCRPISARKRFELVQVVKGARERAESKEGPGIIEDATTTAAEAASA